MQKPTKYLYDPKAILESNNRLKFRIKSINKRSTSGVPLKKKPVYFKNFQTYQQERQRAIMKENELLVKKLKNIYNNRNNPYSKGNLLKHQNLLKNRKKIKEANQRLKDRRLEKENSKLVRRLVEKKSVLKKMLLKPVYKVQKTYKNVIISNVANKPFKPKRAKSSLSTQRREMKLLREEFINIGDTSILFQFFDNEDQIKVFVYKYSNDKDYGAFEYKFDFDECKLTREEHVRSL